MLNRARSDFTVLTLALIPVAIAINIIPGQIVQNTLTLPLYLDSIGTVLVAVLAGPLAAALTGALSNILRAIIFGDPRIYPFTIVALVIGIVAGLLAAAGVFRRELPAPASLLVVGLVGAALVVIQWLSVGPVAGAAALALAALIVALSAMRVFPALVVVGGVVTGIISAVVSTPVVAVVFGGVTGSGTDLLVAFFQAQGASILQATLGQSLVSDPFDKFITFIVVWLILKSMAPRYLARFPRGANIVETEPA